MIGSQGHDIPQKKRRQITPRAGRGLEMLAHAIEYLVDMHEHEGSLLVWEKGHLEAIEILKSLNREIYFSCPVVPTLEDRIRSFFSVKRSRD